MKELREIKRRTDDFPGKAPHDADEGYVIVGPTGGIMAGPYATEADARGTANLCMVRDHTIERARIVG